MKKLVLLTLTALTLMACADNGVSNNNNNGNCVDIIIGYRDVIDGGAYTDYEMKWAEEACTDWDEEAQCRSLDFSKKAIIKECI